MSAGITKRQPESKIPRMWVDVVCLRRDGVKLPPEEVEAAKPVRRLLTVDAVPVSSARAGVERSTSDLAQLWRCQRTDEPEPVERLEHARISRVGGDVLLVLGVERRRNGPGHVQAWLCRVILDANEDNTGTTWHLADTRRCQMRHPLI